MHDDDGVLHRSHFNGINDVEGELDDYAQMARGYLFVHDATGDKKWLDRAKALLAQCARIFRIPRPVISSAHVKPPDFATYQTAVRCRSAIRQWCST